MVCQACGSEIPAVEARFCPRCGAQIAAAQLGPQSGTAVPQPQQYASYPPYPPVAVVPRVQRHLQTLGTLWCVYGIYRIVSGLVGMFFFRAFVGRHYGWWGGPWGNFGMHGTPWMGLLPVMATVAVMAAALAIFTGWSLLNRKPWGRTLAIVLAILALFRIPVGTALGVYTLWVLAPGASGLEYDSIADRS